MTYKPQFPRRKLTRDDGERILWHALEHLRNASSSESSDAFQTIRVLLDSLIAEEAQS